MSLSAYRQARGLSLAQVAERAGITRDVAAGLERNTACCKALSVGQLITLAELYGVDPIDVLKRITTAPRDRQGPAIDPARLEAALSDGREHHREDLAETFDWTLQRTEAAFDQLSGRLRDRGLALTRPRPETYRLIGRPELITDRQRSRLNADRTGAADSPTAAQANVIRHLADTPNHRAARERFTSAEQQAAVSELLADGLLVELDDAIALTDETAFSIYRRRKPPAFIAWRPASP